MNTKSVVGSCYQPRILEMVPGYPSLPVAVDTLFSQLSMVPQKWVQDSYWLHMRHDNDTIFGDHHGSQALVTKELSRSGFQSFNSIGYITI